MWYHDLTNMAIGQTQTLGNGLQDLEVLFTTANIAFWFGTPNCWSKKTLVHPQKLPHLRI